VCLIVPLVCPRPAAAQQPDSWKIPTRVAEAIFPTLQGLDLHSSHLLLAQGAQESNPMMRGPLSAQIALKAGASTAMLLFAETTRKRHPRVAFWVMAATNGAYATIVARNYALRR
jgi:hypothetical protein